MLKWHSIPGHPVAPNYLHYCHCNKWGNHNISQGMLGHIDIKCCLWAIIWLSYAEGMLIVSVNGTKQNLTNVCTVKLVFIYHVLYGSLLVLCHRVVNKGCRLCRPRRSSVAVLVFGHPLHPVVRLHCTLLFAAHILRTYF